jgi:hypothetical protein
MIAFYRLLTMVCEGIILDDFILCTGFPSVANVLKKIDEVPDIWAISGFS